MDERARGFLAPGQLALLPHIEPNTHGAGGWRWLGLQETVIRARSDDAELRRTLVPLSAER